MPHLYLHTESKIRKQCLIMRETILPFLSTKPQWRVRQTGWHTMCIATIMTQTEWILCNLSHFSQNFAERRYAHKYHNIRNTPNTCRACINKTYSFIFYIYLHSIELCTIKCININAVWKYLNLMKVCCDRCHKMFSFLGAHTRFWIKCERIKRYTYFICQHRCLLYLLKAYKPTDLHPNSNFSC